MTVPPDVLDAFIDNRLGRETAAYVAAELAKNPELAAYVEDQKALKTALASPQIAWMRQARDCFARQSGSWIPATAMAAGIVLGVLLSASFGIGTDMRSDGGSLVAQAGLAHMLTTALPSDGDGGQSNTGRIGVSFWSKNGSFCRSFTTLGSAGSALAGIACRERGAWRIAVISTLEGTDASASPVAALPASVRSVMENLIVGAPLDQNAERQARSQSWRPR